MPRDDAAPLDILKAARLTVGLKGTLDQSAFLEDFKAQSAQVLDLLQHYSYT